MQPKLTRRAFLGAAGALALAACSQAAEPEAAGSASTVEPSEPSTLADAAPEPAPAPADNDTVDPAFTPVNNALVVYYSRADENYAGGGTEWLDEGHTKVMASAIAGALGADTYEIVPAEPYPAGYDDCCDVALSEQSADARPAIAAPLPDVSAYDLVFVGCPIWWGEEPMIVRTFAEGVDLSGKTVVPFTTHGGSGLGSVPANLQRIWPNSIFQEGKAVAGTQVDASLESIAEWAVTFA